MITGFGATSGLGRAVPSGMSVKTAELRVAVAPGSTVPTLDPSGS